MTDPYRRAAASIRKQRAQREQNIARNDEAVADIYTVTGRFMIDGTGEAVQEVKFPVNFVEIPNFTYSSELAPGESVAAGTFPRVSSTILNWQTTADDKPIEAAAIYTGCNIGVLVTCVQSRKIWIHWRMEGLAVSNPVHNAQTAGGYA